MGTGTCLAVKSALSIEQLNSVILGKSNTIDKDGTWQYMRPYKMLTSFCNKAKANTSIDNVDSTNAENLFNIWNLIPLK